MRSFTRRFSLLAVLGLIASLTVAGFAVADEHGTEDAPFASDVDDTFTWSYEENEDGTATIYWSVGDEEVDCSDPATAAEDENCTAVDVEPSEDGLNHGDYVSAFAESLDGGPGSGCLVAAVATSDAGMPEDENGDDEVDENGHKGCPPGLYDWLQTFTGENAGDGPPPWLSDQLPAQAGGNGAEAGAGNAGAANAPSLPAQAGGGDE